MRRHFEFRETVVTIEAPDDHIPVGERALLEARGEVEGYIARDPFFGTTFEPYPPREGMGEVVRRMCQASCDARVGPMAAVAGAIAERAMEAMVREGCPHCLVDNGGDIALHTSGTVTVGLYAGQGSMGDLAMEVPATSGPLGICTSSGTIGPSISLGRADLATVISRDVALADACATRLGNLVSDDEEGTLHDALREVLAIAGVRGALVMVAGKLALAGDVPRLMRCRVPEGRITRVRYER
ncbi:MAG: UPF0280 family protein [Methanomassiliicoccales archaeon]|nr:UPF0280 family protein [Methanomassiliicoccales archaeon]